MQEMPGKKLAAELHSDTDVVTGALGYSGKYIARRLLMMGRKVRTLTGHPNRPNPFGEQVDVAPLDFQNPRALVKGLEGAAALYNTYWVRFPRGQVTFEQAVKNTEILIRAAQEAGVRRLVHLSVTNPSADSPLPYFRGKATVEKIIRQSKLSYAILRPTVIFGAEDILINNIAWCLRRFRVFPVFGKGDYRVQPVCVEDLADIAVAAGQEHENVILDAVGPETYTFEELVRLIAEKVGSGVQVIHARPGLALFLSRLIGYVVRDVVLTRDEVRGLMANLLVSAKPPLGQTRLSEWLRQYGDRLGRAYAAELKRHYL